MSFKQKINDQTKKIEQN